MKKLLYTLAIFSTLIPITVSGQIIKTFKFAPSDSLTRYISDFSFFYMGYGSDSTTVAIDTTGIHIWQIGSTLKPVFSNDTIASRGIMTDTLHHYPTNANDFFTLELNSITSPVIDIWHKYQTDSSHAGGTLEFSTDLGLTWDNIISCASSDSSSIWGIYTQNVYSAKDTLLSGMAAFTGNSNGEQHINIQFTNCLGSKPLSTGCSFIGNPSFFLRFRFISDSIIDSLSGWMIDSIRIQGTGCKGGYVPTINEPLSLTVHPNPSYDGVFSFSPLVDEAQFTTEIYNSLGMKILTLPYNESIDLGAYPQGMYFYNVSNGNIYYTGKLMKE